MCFRKQSEASMRRRGGGGGAKARESEGGLERWREKQRRDRGRENQKRTFLTTLKCKISAPAIDSERSCEFATVKLFSNVFFFSKMLH